MWRGLIELLWSVLMKGGEWAPLAVPILDMNRVPLNCFAVSCCMVLLKCSVTLKWVKIKELWYSLCLLIFVPYFARWMLAKWVPYPSNWITCNHAVYLRECIAFAHQSLPILYGVKLSDSRIVLLALSPWNSSLLMNSWYLWSSIEWYFGSSE